MGQDGDGIGPELIQLLEMGDIAQDRHQSGRDLALPSNPGQGEKIKIRVQLDLQGKDFFVPCPREKLFPDLRGGQPGEFFQQREDIQFL